MRTNDFCLPWSVALPGGATVLLWFLLVMFWGLVFEVLDFSKVGPLVTGWLIFVAAGRFWVNSEWSTITLCQKVGLADWLLRAVCSGSGLPSACLVQYEHAAGSSLASHIKRQCIPEGLLLRVLNTLQLGRRQQSSGRGRFKLGESAQTFTGESRVWCRDPFS